MVVSSVKGYNINSPVFGARTRSERENERDGKRFYAEISEDDVEVLRREYQRRKAEREKRAQEFRVEEDIRKMDAEYRRNINDLRETRELVNDITNPERHVVGKGVIQKTGSVLDVMIAGALSGMALHWSTGKAFMMLHKISKKPKVAKVLSNIKKPFAIVTNAIDDGIMAGWKSMSKQVVKTDSGKKFVNSKPIKAVNSTVDDMAASYRDFKSDMKKVTADDVRSVVATTFGISGFVTGAVQRMDARAAKQKQGE